MMEDLKEMRNLGFPIMNVSPHLLTTDNPCAVKFARLPKTQPRTEHIHVKHQHSLEYVERGNVSIYQNGDD